MRDRGRKRGDGVKSSKCWPLDGDDVFFFFNSYYLIRIILIKKTFNVFLLFQFRVIKSIYSVLKSFISINSTHFV